MQVVRLADIHVPEDADDVLEAQLALDEAAELSAA